MNASQRTSVDGDLESSAVGEDGSSKKHRPAGCRSRRLDLLSTVKRRGRAQCQRRWLL